MPRVPWGGALRVINLYLRKECLPDQNILSIHFHAAKSFRPDAPTLFSRTRRAGGGLIKIAGLNKIAWAASNRYGSTMDNAPLL